jgi:hypothetical protein
MTAPSKSAETSYDQLAPVIGQVLTLPLRLELYIINIFKSSTSKYADFMLNLTAWKSVAQPLKYS